jgi:hypothetical protein
MPGDILGVANIMLNGQTYAKIPLVAIGSASRHDLKTSIEKVVNCWLSLASGAATNVSLPEFDL